MTWIALSLRRITPIASRFLVNTSSSATLEPSLTITRRREMQLSRSSMLSAPPSASTMPTASALSLVARLWTVFSGVLSDSPFASGGLCLELGSAVDQLNIVTIVSTGRLDIELSNKEPEEEESCQEKGGEQNKVRKQIKLLGAE